MHTYAITNRLQRSINEDVEINLSPDQELEPYRHIPYLSISHREEALVPESIRSITLGPQEEKAINPVNIGRTIDLSYRRTFGRIPIFGSFCPDIPSFFILLVLLACPPLGVLLVACNFLSTASGVSSPEKWVRERYRRMLTQANPGEQKQQGQLISRNKGELIAMTLRRLPVVSEVCFLADTVTGTVSSLTNQRIPSLSATLTDKINEVLPQNIDFSALNPRGNCFGLVMVGFAARKAGMRREFYETLNNAMTKAQSLFNTKLNEAERQLIQVISDVQKKQNGEIKIPCLGRSNAFISLEEEEKSRESLSIYERDRRFDETLYEKVLFLIETVAQRPGELTTISLRAKDGGHRIGITAEQDSDGIQIEIDDPNYPMAPFRDITEAAKAFKYLLCSEYEDYFRSDHWQPNIIFRRYQSEVLEMQPQIRMPIVHSPSRVPRSLVTDTDRYLLLGREWCSFLSSFATQVQQRQQVSDESKAVVRFTG